MRRGFHTRHDLGLYTESEVNATLLIRVPMDQLTTVSVRLGLCCTLEHGAARGSFVTLGVVRRRLYTLIGVNCSNFVMEALNITGISRIIYTCFLCCSAVPGYRTTLFAVR